MIKGNYPQSDTVFSVDYPQSVTWPDRIERELDKIM